MGGGDQVIHGSPRRRPTLSMTSRYRVTVLAGWLPWARAAGASTGPCGLVAPPGSLLGVLAGRGQVADVAGLLALGLLRLGLVLGGGGLAELLARRLGCAGAATDRALRLGGAGTLSRGGRRAAGTEVADIAGLLVPRLLGLRAAHVGGGAGQGGLGVGLGHGGLLGGGLGGGWGGQQDSRQTGRWTAGWWATRRRRPGRRGGRCGALGRGSCLWGGLGRTGRPARRCASRCARLKLRVRCPTLRASPLPGSPR